MSCHQTSQRIIFEVTLSIIGLASSLCVSAPSRETFWENDIIERHGPSKQSGDRRFDALINGDQTPDEAMQWQKILDQANLGETPPEIRVDDWRRA